MRTGASPAITEVVATLLDNLGTSLSLHASQHVKSGKWDELQTKLNPSSYPATSDGALQFRDDFQVVELVRKRVFGGSTTSKQRREAAKRSWRSSESVNYRTNQRLSLWQNGIPSHEDPIASAAIVSTIDCVKREIRRVLGRLPKSLPGRFSSGTNEGPVKVYHTIVHKLSQPSCTSELASVLAYQGEGLAIPFAWERSLLTQGITINSLPLVRGEGFGTVSKNYLTDRTIGKQPVVNLFFQLGVGGIIRQSLKERASIDLDFGHLEHSRLACEGSISNRIATIDLRNASNSLAIELVRLLLDEEWFDLLDLLRSKYARIDGKWQKLEMFSAMGNGFTFELQSLIFWAVCRACGVITPKVYGDDIIVPTEHAKDVVSVLAFFGFEINPDKTFIDGPFRESCGGNFFNGVDVTPIRFTGEPSTPLDWFTIHNQIHRLGKRCAPAKRLALNQIPTDLRKFGGPVELGDAVLHGRPCSRRWRGQIGFIKCVRPLPIKWFWKRMFDGWDSSHLQMAVALTGTLSGGDSKKPHWRSDEGFAPPSYDQTDLARVTPHYLTSRGTQGWKVGRIAWSGNALLRYSGGEFHLHG